MINIETFVKESNMIEGITRSPTTIEIGAHKDFLNLEEITVDDLIWFVSLIQPDAELRDKSGLNVRVGEHIPPPGGPAVCEALESLLNNVNEHRGFRFRQSAYFNHCDYETLHPFTDGNGRSGRVLWLWQNNGYAPLSFLHQFYYQSLQAYRPFQEKDNEQK